MLSPKLRVIQKFTIAEIERKGGFATLSEGGFSLATTYEIAQSYGFCAAPTAKNRGLLFTDHLTTAASENPQTRSAPRIAGAL